MPLESLVLELTGGSTRFGGGLENADLLTKASLAFIKTAVFPSLSFKAGVILNCRGWCILGPSNSGFYP